MIAVELFVVLLFIFLGARIGGIGIGFAGGAGVIALSLILGVPTSQSFIPIDVILIIMSVITAIAAMQVAGGMDWLVQIAENFLRKHPERITFYAPIVTFVMTLMAGTGHTAFSTLPVIAEVAKGQGVRPSRPLSIAVVASQIAITASPISAAVVAFAAMLAPFGVDYLTLLMVCIPTTFIACMVGAVVANYMGCELHGLRTERRSCLPRASRERSNQTGNRREARNSTNSEESDLHLPSGDWFRGLLRSGYL